MTDPRERLFYWDGKQVKLSDFLTELGIDPDDDGNSCKGMYRKMGVSLEEEPP